MGRASGGEVFDSVASSVTIHVANRVLSEKAATKVLASLARALFEQDWDTEDESADRFSAHPFVIAALRDADAFPCNDPEQIDDHEDCSEHAPCQQ